MRILLVDQHDADYRLLESALSKGDGVPSALVWAKDLPDAIAQVQQEPFDVILLDLDLPTTQGLDSCEALLHAIPHLPIVVLTSADDAQLSTELLRRGAQDSLVKQALPGPVIRRILQYAIERFRSYRESRESSEQVRLLLERIPAIVWTTDGEFRLISCHGAALSRLGLDPRPHLGGPIGDFFGGDSSFAQMLQKHHQEIVQGRGVAFDFQLQQREFEAQLSPLRSAAGVMAGTIGVAIDVTDRRQEQAEMEAARVVQQALLPKAAPIVEGFDIAGAAFPAARTCGDWFDFVPSLDGSWVLILGDVSGHGLPAAMLASNGSAGLAALVQQQKTLSETLAVANLAYWPRTRTVDFGVVNLVQVTPGSAEIRVAAAGEQTFILRSNGSVKQEIAAVGMPLWLAPDSTYAEDVVVRLDPGDMVVLLTDGFREALSPEREMFLNARVFATINQRSQEPAAEILQELWQAVRKFAGDRPQADDMAGIIIKYDPRR